MGVIAAFNTTDCGVKQSGVNVSAGDFNIAASLSMIVFLRAIRDLRVTEGFKYAHATGKTPDH